MTVHLMIATLIFIATSYCNAWGAPVATYIAEFSASGASRPDEIKTTIQTLLLSRLASDTISTQVKPEGAEIKVSGSYLLSGDLFSLDSTAVNSAGVVVARAFSQGKSPDDLIPAVGTLAKLLAAGIEKSNRTIVTPNSLPQAPDIIKAAPMPAVAGQTVFKLDGALHSMAVGRTLPDGERDLFVAGSHTLRYLRQGKELALMTEIPFKVFEKVLAVDTADLDGNGTAEIYLTVVSNEILTSQVWIVEGKSLKKIADRLPYFFRTITTSGGVKKLYAQQMSSSNDFSGEVSEVIATRDGYAVKNPLKLPKNGYLYNFALLKTSAEHYITILTDRSGYLRAYNRTGDEISKGVEEVGGSETFFQRSDPDSQRSSGMRKVYLDQRMVLTSNGELLVAKNSASWYMRGKHSYSKSSLYSFVWDGANLNEKWHTRQNDYYLSDIAYDDSSREVLMLEIVAKEEGVFDKGASRLVIRKVD